jgi:hypothetical protein
MVPPFDADGNLPEGIHLATWAEAFAAFGTTPHRIQLLQGFQAASEILYSAGCRRVYLDGSFVTSKASPDDFDALWDATGVDVASLLQREPCFGDFSNGRAAQKAKFLGEFFPRTFANQVSAASFSTSFKSTSRRVCARALWR